jgi:hypothetical protein
VAKRAMLPGGGWASLASSAAGGRAGNPAPPAPPAAAYPACCHPCPRRSDRWRRMKGGPPSEGSNGRRGRVSSQHFYNAGGTTGRCARLVWRRP